MRPKRSRYLLLLVVAVLALYALTPLVWMFVTSLKATGEPLENLLPRLRGNMFDNYAAVWRASSFRAYFRNSLIVALTTSAIAVTISALAGYAFARLKFPGMRLVVFGVLMTQMMPGVLLLMPLFILVMKLQLLNTLFSLVLVTTAFALPFSLWTMRGYFVSVPKELEEAALVDGCSELGALFRVIIPLVGPGAAAVGIFAFTVAWQEYIFALSFLTHEGVWTVPVGLNAFIGQYGANWPELCAAGVLATVPTVLLFGLLQKYFVTGITAGAVKG